MKIDDTTIQALSSSLKFREMRQKLLSTNVANAETPGYKAKRLDFEEALARAVDLDKLRSMNADDDKHFNVGGGSFSNLEPEVYNDPNGNVSDDDNSVDVADEMARMAENKVLYDASVQLLNKKLGLMKYAVSSEK